MHHSGPLPLTFEGLEQGFGGKNCQNGSLAKPCLGISKLKVLSSKFRTFIVV